jgi:hypothetical protein
MVLQPATECRGGPIGQQVNRVLAFQINQDRAVGSPFAQGKVIDTKDTWCRESWARCLTHDAQERVGAHGHMQAMTEPRAGFTTGGKGQRAQGACEP